MKGCSWLLWWACLLRRHSCLYMRSRRLPSRVFKTLRKLPSSRYRF